MVGIMRGEAGREIREKSVQLFMRIARVVKWRFVKAAHGFGIEANLDIELAVGSIVKSAG